MCELPGCHAIHLKSGAACTPAAQAVSRCLGKAWLPVSLSGHLYMLKSTVIQGHILQAVRKKPSSINWCWTQIEKKAFCWNPCQYWNALGQIPGSLWVRLRAGWLQITVLPWTYQSRTKSRIHLPLLPNIWEDYFIRFLPMLHKAMCGLAVTPTHLCRGRLCTEQN